MTEYGCIAGLIAIAAVGGLKLFGANVEQLFQHSKQEVGSSKMGEYVSMRFGQPEAQHALSQESTPITGSNPYSMPGLALPLHDTAGSPTNVTSVEGSLVNTVHSMQDLQKIESLIATLTDPAAIRWAQQLSQVTHFMVGAEGENTGVKELTVKSVPDSGMYADASALRDVFLYQQQLGKLLEAPPAGADVQTVQQILALGQDALGNAQPFLTQLKPYIKADGSLDVSAWAAKAKQDGEIMSTTPYDQTISYADLQKSVTKALQSNLKKVPQTVQTTLVDAKTLQTASTLPVQTSAP